MSVQDLNELFEHELKDIYFAEQKLVAALQELAGESTEPEIKKAFAEHQKETVNHVRRLERVFRSFGEPPEAEVCQGIEGLLREKKSFSKEKPTPQILDYYNLGAGAKTERYEITAYESLVAMARKLKMTQAVELLRENLLEEQAALRKLKALARGFNTAQITGAKTPAK